MKRLNLLNLHLAHELAAKSVDDTGDGGSGTLADEVEIEHALYSSRLHATVDILVSKITPDIEHRAPTIRSILSCCERESVPGG